MGYDLQYESDPWAWTNAPNPLYLLYRPAEGKLRVYGLLAGDQHCPLPVEQGVELRFGLPPQVDAEFLTGALAQGEYDDQLDQIALGHSQWWDGQNVRGRLSAAGQAACEELAQILSQAPTVEVVDSEQD